MNWILDISVVAIMALSIAFAAKKGFIRTLISSVSFGLAIIVALCFSQQLADTLKKTSVAEHIESVTEQKISDIILENSIKPENLLTEQNEKFDKLCSVAGISKSALINELADTEINAAEMAKKISSPIINSVALLMATVILFLGTKLVLAIIAHILGAVCRLPVLKGLDKTLGVILGIVLGALRIALFCFIVCILTENAEFLGSTFISSLNPDSTLIYKYISNPEIFGFFLK